MDNTYHKTNLKEELIKNTIEIIAKEGVKSVSMRSLALKCNVSRQAPYSYFKNKEDMLQAASDYVSNLFSEYLLKSIEGLDRHDPKTLNTTGYAYINFFKENPYYFDFIYNNGLFDIVVTLDEAPDNFKPFDVFRMICAELTEIYHMPKSLGLANLVRCFSIVHGAAMLVSSKNVKFDNLDVCFSQLFNFSGREQI